jgi:hypothetical protein
LALREQAARAAAGVIDQEKALPWIEEKSFLSLAESHIAAIRLASCRDGGVGDARPGRIYPFRVGLPKFLRS